MSTQDNKVLIQKWVEEVLNTGDVSERSPAYADGAPKVISTAPHVPVQLSSVSRK